MDSKVLEGNFAFDNSQPNFITTKITTKGGEN